jgi:hypothetical protein
MASAQNNVVALSKRSPIARRKAGAVITANEYLGMLVGWDFGSDDAFGAPRATISDVFEKHGFGGTISASITPGNAIKATLYCAGIKPGRGFLVKPLAKPNKDTPEALGIYVRRDRDESGDEWECGARVRWDALASTVVALPPEGSMTADAKCLEIAERFAVKANDLFGNVRVKELSEACIAAGRSLQWAPFRHKGGVYWIPPQHAERMAALLDDLETCGDERGFYPIVQPVFADSDDRTVKNLERAAQTVLDEDLAELQVDLDKMMAEGMRESSVANRVAQCQALVIKAELYRRVLADHVDVVTAKIDGIRAQFESKLTATDGGVFANIEKALIG